MGYKCNEEDSSFRYAFGIHRHVYIKIWVWMVFFGQSVPKHSPLRIKKKKRAQNLGGALRLLEEPGLIPK